MVQMRSAGVVNICYYYTGGERGAMPWFSTMANGYYVLMDYDGRPKPTMMAYSALEQQLERPRLRRRGRGNDLTVHLFAKAPARSRWPGASRSAHWRSRRACSI